MNPGTLTRVQTASSGSLKEASRRAIKLYRNILKVAPKVKTVFDVDMTVGEMRSAITWHFRKSAQKSVSKAQISQSIIAKKTKFFLL